MGEQPNGNTLRYRVEQLEVRLAQHEQGIKFNSEGAIRRDDRIEDLRGDVDEMKPTVARVPIVESKVDRILKSMDRVGTAAWATAGSLIVLAATIVLKAG